MTTVVIFDTYKSISKTNPTGKQICEKQGTSDGGNRT